jgi:hypothetical protein
MNPLETFESIETLDRTIKDKSRDRSIPLKFYFPVGKTNSPVIYLVMDLEVAGMDVRIWENIGQVVDMSQYLCSMLGVMNRFGKMWVLFAECLLSRKPPPTRILCFGCTMFPPFWIN